MRRRPKSTIFVCVFFVSASNLIGHATESIRCNARNGSVVGMG